MQKLNDRPTVVRWLIVQWGIFFLQHHQLGSQALVAEASDAASSEANAQTRQGQARHPLPLGRPQSMQTPLSELHEPHMHQRKYARAACYDDCTRRAAEQ